MIRLVIRPRCPRCNGSLLREYDEEPTCINCGWEDVPDVDLAVKMANEREPRMPTPLTVERLARRKEQARKHSQNRRQKHREQINEYARDYQRRRRAASAAG